MGPVFGNFLFDRGTLLAVIFLIDEQVEVTIVIIVVVNDYSSVDGCGNYNNVDTCNRVEI